MVLTLPYNVLYATDLHGRTNLYRKIFDYASRKGIEAIIFGGDLTPKNHFSLEIIIDMQADFLNRIIIPEIRNFVDECHKDVFLMMGNDDCRINYEILEEGERDGLYRILDSHRNRILGFNIIGYSFVPVTPFRLKDWEKYEDEKKQVPPGYIDLSSPDAITTTGKINEGSIRQDFAKIKKLSDPSKTIYVIHSPPMDTALDITRDGMHCGSRAVRDFIEKEQPYLTLHGHIHESYVMSGKFKEKIGKTLALNPGAIYKNNEVSFLVIDLLNPDKAEMVKI